MLRAGFSTEGYDCYLPSHAILLPMIAELQLSNPRTELDALQFKRQKLNHPTTGSQPSVFWDNLSETWLTRGAVKELNRRNNQPTSSQPRSQHRRARLPVTRNFLAELKRNRRVTQSASDYLHHCGPRTLKDIKRFARNGGPDLSDLKGVSITRYPLTSIETDALQLPEPVDPLNHIMSSSQSSSQSRKRSLASTLNTRSTMNTINTKITESSGPYSRNF